jgi:hypothetical protein
MRTAGQMPDAKTNQPFIPGDDTMREQITLSGDIAEPSIRELSLDETELVGGGFSWGGLVHGVEHGATNVLHAAEAGAGAIAGGGAAKGAGKLASKAWKAIERFRAPPAEPGSNLPPDFWLPPFE